uniref:PawS1a n=1 Tax=Gaillardia pulchella TaxID=128738 RepID=A0A1V0JB85_GAIPU|nr:PawS1a [Gaillardia pulchella]
MTKVAALVVLAFATIVAAVSGYRTTITTTITNGRGGRVCTGWGACLPDGLDNGRSATTTTTIEDNSTGGTVCTLVPFPFCFPDGLDNPTCSQMAELKHCQMHLQQQGSEQQHLGLCCNQLQQLVKEECQCEAIKQVVQQASAQLQSAGKQQQHMLLTKAQKLPNQCNLKVHKSCPILRIPTY